MTRDDWRWAMAAIALPIALCALRLNLDLWADETYTLLHFARQPVRGIVTDYSAPNNHILFSLLIRPVYLLSSEAFVLRLPLLAIALGTLLLTFRFARVHLGRVAAVSATLALGLNVMFLVHTMQVRGYGLSMLLAVALANLAVPLRDSSLRAPQPATRFRDALAIVLAGTAFLYTIPTNALFFVPLAGWAVYAHITPPHKTWSALRAAVPWLCAIALALLVYLPVLSQMRSLESDVPPQSNPGQLVLAVYRAQGHDVWPVWLLLPWAVWAWRKPCDSAPPDRDSRVPVFLLVMLTTPLLLCAVLRINPFVRNFCPLLLFFALATGGIIQQVLLSAALSRLLGRGEERRLITAAAILLLLLLPANLLYSTRLTAYRQQQRVQDGYYNYYAANFEPWCVVRCLREHISPHSSYAIYYADRDYYDLVHQLARAGFPIPPHHRYPSPPGSGQIYVVLPSAPDWPGVERNTGLTRKQIESFPVVCDCGYFQARRAPVHRQMPPAPAPRK